MEQRITANGSRTDHDLRNGLTENEDGDLIETGSAAEETDPKDVDSEDPKVKPLTEKMVSLMQKISEYRYLSMNEIGLIYANQTYAYNVINALKDKRLLDEFPTTLKPRKAYYLRTRGYRLLEKYGRLRVKRWFNPNHFTPFIFNHRMACARVGLTLEKHPLIHDFLPESLLWERRSSRQGKLCDGEFSFHDPVRGRLYRVGLEVELTLKNSDKLAESFRELNERENLEQVWWVCGDTMILNVLSREIRGRRSWPLAQQHFLCIVEEALRDGTKLKLRDPEGFTFGIDPERPQLPPPPSPAPASATTPPTPLDVALSPLRQEPPAPVIQPPLPPLMPPALPPRLEPARESRPWWEPAEPSLMDHIQGWWGEFKGWCDELADFFLRVIAVGLILAVIVSLAWYATPRSFLPDPPLRPLRWHDRTVEVPSRFEPYWRIGAFHFWVSLLESKGENYRMQLSLERAESEYWGDCVLRSVEVDDAKYRRLGRWQAKDADSAVTVRGSWRSQVLSFRAPAGARKFYVKMGLSKADGPWGEWCADASIPVSFR